MMLIGAAVRDHRQFPPDGDVFDMIYRNARLARRVNVEATATVVRVAETQPGPPRFVQASSNAVFGARNPHRHTEILRADDPMRPCDLYSATKAEAEQIVRSSSLEWVVLRFGAVLSTDLLSMPFNTDALFFENVLPTDGRMHSVDVRDVAAACAAATTADVAREILLIAGDESHHLRQGEVGPALSAALGIPGALPEGRPGDPESDTDWFATDWMEALEPDFYSTIYPMLVASEQLVLALAAIMLIAARAEAQPGGAPKATLGEVLQSRRSEIDVRLQALQLETEIARTWAQLNFLVPIDHASRSGR